MIVWNPSGTDTKTFTGHSTRTALSSKAKGVGVPTRGNFKTRVLVKGIKFEKLYLKEINAEDPHLQLFVLKSFEKRLSKQWLSFSNLMRRANHY